MKKAGPKIHQDQDTILDALYDDQPKCHMLNVIEYKYLLKLNTTNRIFLLRMLAHFIAVEAVRFNYREMYSLKDSKFPNEKFELSDYPVTEDEFLNGPLKSLAHEGIKVAGGEPKTSIGKFATACFCVILMISACSCLHLTFLFHVFKLLYRSFY